MTYIEMPKLSDTMTEGTVVKWRKAVGDPVGIGDVIAEIETDKAVMELEAFDGGTLQEIYVSEGGKAPIGEKLALLLATGEDAPQKDGQAAKSQQVNPPAPSPSRTPPSPAKAEKATAPVSRGRVKASPLAKKIAGAKSVDLALIQGSGPGGRIVARDLESAPAAAHGVACSMACWQVVLLGLSEREGWKSGRSEEVGGCRCCV